MISALRSNSSPSMGYRPSPDRSVAPLALPCHIYPCHILYPCCFLPSNSVCYFYMLILTVSMITMGCTVRPLRPRYVHMYAQAQARAMVKDRVLILMTSTMMTSQTLSPRVSTTRQPSMLLPCTHHNAPCTLWSTNYAPSNTLEHTLEHTL